MRDHVDQPFKAAVLVMSGMAVIGFIDNFVAFAAISGGLWQFHMLRSLLALALLAPLALVMGWRLRPRRGWPVLVRSALNAGAMLLYFGALGLLPISQALAGLFTAPVFIVIFSVVLFGEKVGLRRVLAVMIGFVGALLALRPEASGLSLYSLIPLLSGAFYAAANMSTRRLCAGEAAGTLLGGYFVMMTLAGLIGMVAMMVWPHESAAGAAGFLTRGWVAPVGSYLWIIVLQAVGSLVGVALSIRGYQSAEAGFVSVFENSILVFATIWAFILKGELPDAVGLTGLALIAVAGVIIALRSTDPVSQRLPVDRENQLAERP